MKIQIKNRFDASILFETEAASVKLAVQAAVEKKENEPLIDVKYDSKKLVPKKSGIFKKTTIEISNKGVEHKVVNAITKNVPKKTAVFLFEFMFA